MLESPGRKRNSHRSEPPQVNSPASVLRIGILEGDDIGLEVVPESVKVMKAAAAMDSTKHVPLLGTLHRDGGVHLR